MQDVSRPTFDVVLDSSDDASPTTSVGLMLARAPNGRPLVKESRQAVFPGRRTFGNVTTASKDPLIDFTWEQSDWSGGALQALYDVKQPNKYASSNGCELRGKNVATLGMQRQGAIGFLVRNGGAEDGNTNGWSVVNTGTLTAVTTDTPRTGTYQFQLAGAVAGGTPTTVRQRLGQTNGTALENQNGNPEVYQGRSLSVYVYAKRGTTGTATIRTNIIDSVGTTNGTGVALTTAFQLVQATRTVDSAATSLRWEIEVTALTGGATIFFDDFTTIPAGGLVCRGFVDGPEELLYNGGAEINTTTAWTTTGAGVTFSSSTTAPYNGSVRHWALGSASGNTVIAYQSITGPTDYRSRSITFSGFLRESAADATGRLFIQDDVGTTNGTDLTLTTTYQATSVTRVIDSTATFVRLGIERTSTSNVDVFADELRAYTRYDNPVEARSPYAVFGRTVCRFDEATDTWNAVFINSANVATSLVEYNDFNYVAFGNGDNAYTYGTGTSWVVSNLTGDAKYAHFFTVSRRTLFRSRFDGNGTHNFVDSSTSPQNAGSWAGEVSVGSDNRSITGLYTVKDRVVTTKEDSMFVFNRVANDWAAASDWQHIMNDFTTAPSATNFDRGGEQEGWLYLAADLQKVYRFDGRDQLQDISSLFWAPRLADFGGRIRAWAPSSSGLFFLLDTPTSDTTVTKDTWLMNMSVRGSGLSVDDYIIHAQEQVRIGDINKIAVNNVYLWALGRVYNSDISDYLSAIHRWILPEKSQFPAYDDTPATNTTGTFDTAIWDGSLPDDDKAFTKLTIYTQPSTLNQTGRSLVAQFRVNQSSSYTTLATFTGSGASQTAFFDTITTPETTAVGRAIQLRFQLNTNAASDRVTDATNPSPALYGFALHGQLRPDRIRVWDMWFQIGDGVQLGNGQLDPREKEAVLSNLQTLEQQDYPIRITADIDGNGTNELNDLSVIIRPGSVVRDIIEERARGVEVWRMSIVEVVTA